MKTRTIKVRVWYQPGVHGESRTRDLCLRRATLYPTELREQFIFIVSHFRSNMELVYFKKFDYNIFLVRRSYHEK